MTVSGQHCPGSPSPAFETGRGPRTGLARAAGRWFLLLVAAAGLAGCASAPTFVSSPPPDTNVEAALANPVLGPGDVLEVAFLSSGKGAVSAYVIAPEDRLGVMVSGHPELSRDRLLVLSDGSVSLPELGRVQAAGLKVDELTAELSRRYKEMFIRTPKVTVNIEEADVRLQGLLTRRPGAPPAEATPFRVSDSGTIDLPYIDRVTAGRTLADIRADIASAYKQVFGGRVEVTVNLRQARPKVVYVIGEVAKPGVVEYRRPFNPLMAISTAGGFMVTAEPANVVLFRFNPDGTSSQWMMNFRDPLEGKGGQFSSLAVLPDDVLFVPKSGISISNDRIDQYVRKMIPIPFGVFGSFPIGTP